MPSTRKKVETADGYLSLPRAARELRCSRQKVLNAIARKELVSELVADRVVVTKESVERLKSRAA